MTDAPPVSAASEWQGPAGDNRPTIGLVVVQGYVSEPRTEALQALVARTCETLNTLMGQTGPRFRSYDNDQLLVDVDPIGERRREYPKEAYWSVLRAKKGAYGTTYAIGICEHQLAEASFTLNARERGIGVVSTAGYRLFSPPGLTRERYLMYLVVSVALLLDNPNVREHYQAAGCLFDEYRPVEQIMAGLRRPSLEHCRQTQLGHRSNQELAPYRAVLAEVGHRDPITMLTSHIGDRAVVFALGVFVAFVTNLLVSEWPQGAAAAAWACAIGIVAILTVRPLARLTWVQRRRRASFVALVAVAAAVAVAGMVVMVGRDIPPWRNAKHSLECTTEVPDAVASNLNRDAEVFLCLRRR